MSITDTLNRGRRTISPYRSADPKGTPGQWLTDSLADLRHWAAFGGLDWDHAIRVSADHHKTESPAQPDPDETQAVTT